MDDWEYQKIEEFLDDGTIEPDEKNIALFKSKCANYELRDNVLYHKKENKIVIKNFNLEYVLFSTHVKADVFSFSRCLDELSEIQETGIKNDTKKLETSVHLNCDETLKKLKEIYYCPEKLDIVKYVRYTISICPVCNKKVKRENLSKFDLYWIDILGPFPEINEGEKFLLVLTEYSTQWVFVHSLKDKNVVSVYDYILSKVISSNGPMKYFETNQDDDFNKELAQLMKFCIIYPDTKVGILKNERFGKMLYTHMLNNKNCRWNDLHFSIIREYKNEKFEPENKSPFFRYLGRELNY